MPRSATAKKAAPKKSKPAAKKILWNLGELYAGKDDPKIDKDFKALERGCRRFKKDYHGKVGQLDAAGLKKALGQLERIEKIAFRLFIYAHLEYATKSNDPAWGAFMQSVQERYTQAAVDLEFFKVEWTRLPDERTDKLVADPALARYRHFLEHALQYRKHTLSEPEEIISSKLDQVSGSSWKRYYNTVLSDIVYELRGKKITESELTAKFRDPDRSLRRDASAARAKALTANAKPLTFAFNMMLASRMVGDDVRHYDHWLQSRNLANEIPDKVVNALSKAVLDRNDVLQRYMTVKAKLMKIRPFMSYDVWAPLTKTKQKPLAYDKARQLVTDLFQETRPSFGRIAGELFDRQHVDVPPYKGKRSGAFCMPNMEGYPYVLMNWTGKTRDLATLAHEFGHAIHMELSRKHGPMGSVESLVMAEVASVFMETILYEKLLAEATSPRERLDLLSEIIEDGFATTFRQMQFNRFESAAHNERREKGELSQERLGELYRESEKAYFGDSVKPAPGSDSFWMYISHFVNVPGYVYAYCASYLVVLALYRRYQKVGKGFMADYELMLAAGGSQSPEALLGAMGVDWSKPAFWRGGLEVLGSYVDQFEATAKELKLIK